MPERKDAVIEERRRGFARELERAMRRKGLNQTTLAERLREYGLTARASTVNEWLKKGALPNARFLMVLPEILDTPLDTLLLQDSGQEARQFIADLVAFTEEMKDRYGYAEGQEEAEQAESGVVAALRQARTAVERAEELLNPPPQKRRVRAT